MELYPILKLVDNFLWGEINKINLKLYDRLMLYNNITLTDSL